VRLLEPAKFINAAVNEAILWVSRTPRRTSKTTGYGGMPVEQILHWKVKQGGGKDHYCMDE
jgi:hypothetical protein